MASFILVVLNISRWIFIYGFGLLLNIFSNEILHYIHLHETLTVQVQKILSKC